MNTTAYSALYAARKKGLQKKYRAWKRNTRAKQVLKFSKRPAVRATYVIASIAILCLTTLLWSFLGARLQQQNADQLVNPYLFENGQTARGMLLPGQHSFLIKWPLFYLVKLLGYSDGAFIGVTIGASLLTVGLFVYLLSRIERRPYVLGAICLAMASILLLVPAQPYTGGLLPVNMAMLATRNLEYIWYIASLLLIVRAPRFASKQGALATVLLALLIASDKLFLSISIGAALLSLVVNVIRRQGKIAAMATRWLLVGLAAVIVAIIAIAIVNHTGLGTIGGQPAAGPYQLVDNAKDALLGIFYALAGILTNFGANPAYDALTIRDVPHQFFHNLLSLAGPAYLINASLLLVAVIVVIIAMARSLRFLPHKKISLDATDGFALAAVWSAITVIGLFIAAKHYYVVDARYLGLVFFAVFIAFCNWIRRKKIDAVPILLLTPILLVSIACGSIASLHINHMQIHTHALAQLQKRDNKIVATLQNHHVTTLVGDYWRVLPVKQASAGTQAVMPLAGCTQPRDSLTSKAWQPDLTKKSFAYLLTLEGSVTDYPDCTLQQVIDAYGVPNSSALVAGKLGHPKELLLFYDTGIRKASPSEAVTPSTILPISLDELPATNCRVETIMQIVAHQDDDLLFMNPDLQGDIRAGNCVRTIYVTAGDAGAGLPYWLSREQGSEAAYGVMLGRKVNWVQRSVKLPGGQYVTIANPRDNDRISLIFMHLPDGNVDGGGFDASKHESLARLESGETDRMYTVDRQSNYDKTGLTSALAALFDTYQPGEIRTQSNIMGTQYIDHSDHRATGRFTVSARDIYAKAQFGGQVVVPVRFYIGYPVHELPANVSGQALTDKQAAFFAYAAHDGGVCGSIEACLHVSTYGSYLTRQYQVDY